MDNTYVDEYDQDSANIDTRTKTISRLMTHPIM